MYKWIEGILIMGWPLWLGMLFGLVKLWLK
jgi:hypothetical protein